MSWTLRSSTSRILVRGRRNPGRGDAGGGDLARHRIPGPGEAEGPSAIPAAPHVESSPRLSPDGRWIAYLSDDAGRTHLYLGDFPGGTRRWQVSGDDEPNTVPVWSSRGDVLYYGSRKGIHRAALSATAGSLVPGTPRLVTFETSRLVGETFRLDGDTVVTLMLHEQPAVGPVRLLRNWRSVVRQQTP